MDTYVAGFMFSPSGQQVVLIRKNRPDWQKGRLNAVGGHIERGEQPHDAMVREFLEETGVTHLAWRPLAVIDGARFRLHVFFTMSTDITKVKTVTDEVINTVFVPELRMHNRLENLDWLIALARDPSTRKPVYCEWVNE